MLDILDASSVSRVTNVTSPCLELTSSLTTVWCQPLSPFACRSQSSNIRGVILATSTSRHSKTTCASLSHSVSQLQTSSHTLINSTACLLSYWTSTLQSALLAVIRPRSVDGYPTRRSLLSVKPQESPRPTFYLYDDVRPRLVLPPMVSTLLKQYKQSRGIANRSRKRLKYETE